MRVEVYDSYADLSRRAAALVADVIRQKTDAVLGLPTGGTPEGFYGALSETDVGFSRVQTFNLDEYLGLSRAHPQSYYDYMRRHLFDKVKIPPARTHLPDGMTADPEAECRHYEQAIREAGGLDMVLLGVGHNGHIGFNEPGTPWSSRTRKVQLASRTREANARYFGSLEQVPTCALTMGIGTILEARQILLLASGESKAEIIRRTLEAEPTEEVPSTALRTHPNVTILLDRAAAGALALR